MPNLIMLSVIGLMGNMNIGERQGGVLFIIGHAPGAILPNVDEKSWVEFGPDRKYHRVDIKVTPAEAFAWAKDGWLENVGGGSWCAHRFVMTQRSWRLFGDFDKWLQTWQETE